MRRSGHIWRRTRGQGGIIYCLTRRNVEEICEKLIRDGFSVTRYHAGLSDAERQKNQDDLSMTGFR